MRPRHLQALIGTAVLLAVGSVAAQTPDPHADHASPPPIPHAGRSGTGMETPGTTMPGMDMSGGAMASMSMSGMEPPAPRSPPPGAVLTLNAAESTVAAAGSSPGQITLAFGRPTTLREILLSNAVGQRVPIRATLPATPVERFTFPVTIPLQAGEYQLAWASTDLGPVRRGRVAFAILQTNGTPAPKTPLAHHH